ncbi:hypothetical protein D5018_15870 [Parashewanella curva]|uniref:Uncharacterized protein n=1 Tax=Parashewanella curva TaxID=2338552 RepID=A0A3L8PTF0_9GAMM|nr:hypothetical protein [Parashewanella curva]RLV58695.1 hypothetical protein D5018_15870 [Parashewanella curva]
MATTQPVIEQRPHPPLARTKAIAPSTQTITFQTNTTNSPLFSVVASETPSGNTEFHLIPVSEGVTLVKESPLTKILKDIEKYAEDKRDDLEKMVNNNQALLKGRKKHWKNFEIHEFFIKCNFKEKDIHLKFVFKPIFGEKAFFHQLFAADNFTDDLAHDDIKDADLLMNLILRQLEPISTLEYLLRTSKKHGVNAFHDHQTFFMFSAPKALPFSGTQKGDNQQFQHFHFGSSGVPQLSAYPVTPKNTNTISLQAVTDQSHIPSLTSQVSSPSIAEHPRAPQNDKDIIPGGYVYDSTEEPKVLSTFKQPNQTRSSTDT